MNINRETIVLDTDPIIRTKSEKVQIPLTEEDEALLSDMLQYVIDSQDEEIAKEKDLQASVGIAAIQLGIPKQLIAVVVPDPEDEEKTLQAALANPRIVSESAQNAYLENGEGCLSVKEDHPGHVYRHARIKVRGYDLLKKEVVTFAAEDYFAIALQHEIDHLSGKLFYDRIDEEDPWKEDPEAVVIG